MRVLVVEDEPHMAELIRKGLSREGFAVDVAADGEGCLAMAIETTYDAIVLDVMLPGISGFEACRRLRDEAVWTPVLMLTARDSVDDRVTGLDAGADDYLVKPFAWRRAARPPARPHPPRRHRAADRARGRRPAPRPGHARRPPRRRRDRPLRQGVRAARDVHAPAGRRPAAGAPARARLGRGLSRAGRTSSTSTSATCGPRSTCRSGGRRSRRCAGAATGCAPATADEPHADPDPRRRPLRGRDGRRPARDRPAPLRPHRRRAPDRARPRARAARVRHDHHRPGPRHVARADGLAPVRREGRGLHPAARPARARARRDPAARPRPRPHARPGAGRRPRHDLRERALAPRAERAVAVPGDTREPQRPAPDPRCRRNPREPHRDAARAARRAPGRGPDRARPGHPGGLHPRRPLAAPGGLDAQAGGVDLGGDAGRAAAGSRTPATRSSASARR